MIKKIGITVFTSLLLLSSLAFAENPLEIGFGDIRIFNAGFTVEHLKFKLLACMKGGACVRENLVPIGEESPKLAPGTYYTYRLGNIKATLAGKKLYLEIYNFDQNIWYAPTPIIESYNSKEDPFYQFVCWDRHGPQPPSCSQGAEEEVGGD